MYAVLFPFSFLCSLSFSFSLDLLFLGGILEWLLGEVALGHVKDLRSAQKWFSRTFFSVRLERGKEESREEDDEKRMMR